LTGDAAHGAAIDPIFALFKVARMSCKFSEQKHIALLARPLRSTGTIYFERDRGIARATITPKPQQIVLTRTALHIRKDGRTEDIPLDKSKDLRAFALIFPTLLRGERAELERSFDIALYRGERDWWALAFAPKTESLRGLVRRVVVFGRKSEIASLQVAEASGDTTDTRLIEIKRNGDVPDAEIAAAFGAP
jgi:outer membrane lipoprotein-sorting protein